MLTNNLRYYDTKSTYHKINPTIKLAINLLLIIMTLISNNIYEYLICVFAVILAILLTNIPIKKYLYSIKNITIIMLIIFIFNIILGVNLTLTLLIIYKTYLIVLISSTLIFTTKAFAINEAIEKLLSPLSKILPTKDIAMIISLAIRFIPMIDEQMNRILICEANRGLDIKEGTLSDKLKALKYMLLPSFILTIKKADEVGDILDLRLYNSNVNRTSYLNKTINKDDIMFLLSHILVLFLMIVR